MPANGEERQERRSGTRALIDKLLTERQQMLVLYERVARVEPYSDASPSAAMLEEFSQILVDYIAAGHFGFYDRIADGNERRRGVAGLVDQLYPKIAETTDRAMAFNDAFERSERGRVSEELSERLSGLGEAMAVRIELEDQLIAQLMAR